METTDDMTLLREYAAHNSEAAFETLVSRRVNFVYSAALRQARDPNLAEEITQAVFIILAQKAGKISDKTFLTGWLFKTTRFAALAQIRAAARRQCHEQEVQMQTELQSAIPSAADETWEQMSPLLDEALAALGEIDRQAVLLRFFENRSMAEVGNQLGIGEDTARKRISRALEKLHRFFRRHGVSSTTAIIAGVISANSVHAAPVGIAAKITVTALKGSAVAGTTLALVKGTLKMMTWAKMKLALGTATAILLAGGAVTVALSDIGGKRTAADANERQARIERHEFKTGLVKYAYPPGSPNPVNVSCFSPNEPMLSAEFSWRTDATHPPVAAMRVVIANELGDEFDPSGNDTAGIEEDGDRQYWATGVPVFPRRGKEVRLRLIGNNNDTFAEFTIPNPAPGPYPVWEAQSLPVSATDNDLEVTLEKFRSLQTVTNEDHTPRTECFFRLRENNRETFDWMPVQFEISDATGNHWTASWSAGDNPFNFNPYNFSVENGLMRSELLGALWPGESAWKLRAEFKRAANFPESELLQISHIRIPAADELAQPHVRYEHNGASVELAAVIGKSAPWERGGQVNPAVINVRKLNPAVKKDCISVLLSGQILSRKRQLTFVGATDDKGRPVKLEMFRRGNDSNVPFSFVFHPLDDASELNLLVAVSECRFVEFLVKPEQVTGEDETSAAQ